MKRKWWIALVLAVCLTAGAVWLFGIHLPQKRQQAEWALAVQQ